MGKLRLLLLLLIVIACATPARAAEIRAHLLVDIESDGRVSVTQRWSGLGDIERLSYDTQTAELGVLDCAVKDGNAVLEYSSKELLNHEGDRQRLIIARLERAGEWLDFDVTLRYPGSLEFLNSDPEPSFTSSVARGLMWSLADQRELILQVVFRPYQAGSAKTEGRDGNGTGETAQSGAASHVARGDSSKQESGNTGGAEPDSPPDSTLPVTQESGTGRRGMTEAIDSTQATSGAASNPGQQELLLDGDPLLLEFRLLIGAAAREGKADEDFLQALEKLLMKFYYLLDAMGATDEYKP